MRSPELATDGLKIKAARERAGYTQEELGRLVGVTRAAVAQWESPKTDVSPSGANFKALRKALRVPGESLLVVSDDQAA